MYVVLENKSDHSGVTPEWMQRMKTALNEQAAEFCAIYGLAAWACTLDTTVPGPRLTIFQTSDVAGAAGYHFLTPKGEPSAKVFTDGASIQDIEVDCSHEFLETIDDPDANAYRLGPDGKLRAQEACDAVEDVAYAATNGVMLQDYVLPSWYDVQSVGKWDRQNALGGPLSRTDGGYVILIDAGKATTDPPEAAAAKKSRETSRVSRKLAGLNSFLREHDRFAAMCHGSMTHPEIQDEPVDTPVAVDVKPIEEDDPFAFDPTPAGDEIPSVAIDVKPIEADDPFPFDAPPDAEAPTAPVTPEAKARARESMP